MLKKLAALFFVGSLAFATAAHADQIYTLTVSGCGGSGCSPAPFGTIDIHQISSTEVSVTENLAPGNNFAASAGYALEFNLTGTGTFTISSITSGFSQASGGPFTAPSLTSPPTAANLFGYAINCDTCSGGNGPTSLSFDVTNASGISYLSFTPNGNGYYFTSDIFVNGNTGNVGANSSTTTTSPVPEPSSLMLLGTGIVGAAGVLRRRLIPGAIRG